MDIYPNLLCLEYEATKWGSGGEGGCGDGWGGVNRGVEIWKLCMVCLMDTLLEEHIYTYDKISIAFL